jgi:hypothetical protein
VLANWQVSCVLANWPLGEPVCPIGKFLAQPKGRGCLRCPSGKHGTQPSPSRLEFTCVQCNYHTLEPGSAPCETVYCQPGQFGRLKQVLTSNDDDMNGGLGVIRHQAVSSFSCHDCPVGKLQRSFGSRSCVACGPGRYQPRQAARDCLACARGKFQSLLTSSSCQMCAAGRVNRGSLQAGDCAGCPPGTSTVVYAMWGVPSKCVDCAQGSFQDLDSQSVCIPCRAGQYTSAVGSTACTKCPQTMVPSQTRNSCAGCQPGTYFERKTISCETCPRGDYNVAGSTRCRLCPAGKFWSELSSSCALCPAGKYGPIYWVASAKQYISAGEKCKRCNAGSFVSTAGESGSDNCVKCPAGG